MRTYWKRWSATTLTNVGFKNADDMLFAEAVVRMFGIMVASTEISFMFSNMTVEASKDKLDKLFEPWFHEEEVH